MSLVTQCLLLVRWLVSVGWGRAGGMHAMPVVFNATCAAPAVMHPLHHDREAIGTAVLLPVPSHVLLSGVHVPQRDSFVLAWPLSALPQVATFGPLQYTSHWVSSKVCGHNVAVLLSGITEHQPAFESRFIQTSYAQLTLTYFQPPKWLYLGTQAPD